MAKPLDQYLDDLNLSLAFRLRAFYDRYCSEGNEAYLHLAAHAAFPIAMTPDLLYKIWLNFRTDREQQDLQIPYVAVSDLLLSTLYQASGRNTFEMPLGIREVLVNYLQDETRFGVERVDELAYFLEAYLQENSRQVPSDAFRKAQEYIVMARFSPELAAKKLLTTYNEAENAGEVQHLLNLAEAELGAQKVEGEGRKNPLVVATELVRGVQEYKRGNTEKGLELLERLKGRLSQRSNGGIRVKLDQKILEALPEDNMIKDNRPIFLGAFLPSVSDPTYLSGIIREKDLLEEALKSVNGIHCVSLVDSTSEAIVAALTGFKDDIFIFHFAGYSLGNQVAFFRFFSHGNGEEVSVESPNLGQFKLVELLSQLPKIKLLFLNYANSASLLSELFTLGIPTIIAIDGVVSDDEERDFAVNFYSCLSKNWSVTESFDYSVKLWEKWKEEQSLLESGGRNLSSYSRLTWQLYLNTTEQNWRLSDVIDGFFSTQVDPNSDLVAEEQLESSEERKKDFPHHLNIIPALENPAECIGRSAELAQLNDLINTSNKLLLLSGSAGIGKTTLAQAHIATQLEKYKHFIWIDQNDFLIATIARDPNLNASLGFPLQQDENPEERYMHIIQALKELSGPNLMVIDNATEQVTINKGIESLISAEWEVLVISRQKLNISPSLEIGSLKPKYAAELFSHFYDGGAEKEVNDLLSKLDRHPLSIVLYAKMLHRLKGFLSIQDLLIALRDQRYNLVTIQKYLSKKSQGKNFPLELKEWFDSGGEKELIGFAMIRYLEGHAEDRSVNLALSTWLDASGNLKIIADGLTRYLNKHASKKEAGIVLTSWLKANGALKDVEFAIKEYLSRNAELFEAGVVIQLWIEKRGKTEVIEAFLRKHLTQHANKKEASTIMISWLMNGGTPQVIKTAIKKHLDLHGLKEASLNLLSVWLDNSRDTELVKDTVIKALSQRLEVEQIVLIVNAWLQAGGELKVVQESVNLFMQLGPMELLTSNIIQSWLRAGGEVKVVENGVVRYLDKFARQKETVFLITVWLNAGGTKETIKDAIFEYLHTNAEYTEASFVIQTWLDTGGDKAIIQNALIEFLNNNSKKGSKGTPLVINSWLEATGDKKVIQDGLTRYLQLNVIEPEAAIVFSSWLNANGEKAVIQDSLKRYLELNAEQPDAQFVLCSWLNAGGDEAFVKDGLFKYLRVNGEEKEAGLVISSWLVAKGEKKFIQEFLVKYLRLHAEKPDAQHVIKAWLDNGGDKLVVKDALIKFLNKNAKESNASFVLVAWLGSKGGTELIKDSITKYLDKNADDDKTVSVVNAWLQARGAPNVVEQVVRNLLRKEPIEIVSSTVIQNWLRASGDNKLVELPLQRYLDKYVKNRDSAFIIKDWLDAFGDPSSIERYVEIYLSSHVGTKECNLVLESWQHTMVNKQTRGKKDLQSIKDLIAQARTEEALAQLLQAAPSQDMKNMVIKLKNDYTDLKREKMLGIIDGNEERTRNSRIVVTALGLCDEIVKISNQESAPQNQERRSKETEESAGYHKILRWPDEWQKNQDGWPEIPVEPFEGSINVPRGKSDKIHILFTSASPNNDLKVQKECKLVQDEAMGLPLFFSTLPEVDRGSLINRITYEKPQIVHFSGHSEIGGLQLINPDTDQGQMVSNEDLVELFEHFVACGVKCVVLCSCWSCSQAQAISSLGIPVVGMLKPISDDAAIKFSRDLYYLLSAENTSLNLTFTSARLNMLKKEDRKIPSLWFNGKRIA